MTAVLMNYLLVAAIALFVTYCVWLWAESGSHDE